MSASSHSSHGCGPLRSYRILGRCLQISLLVLGLLVGCGCGDGRLGAAGVKPGASTHLLVFAGAASKPPTEAAALQYQQQTGVRVDLIFGGSGTVLAQMRLARQGDVYLPGSSDYMDQASAAGDVYADTQRVLVYLVPAINVQAGNPKNIQKLEDLARPGLRVAIASPDGVCVGIYAIEIIEARLSTTDKAALRANLVNYTESCAKTAAAVSLKMVDAVIGWRVFEDWDPERIQTVPLDPTQVVRVATIPVAVSRYTTQRQAAQDFIDFLAGPQGQQIFSRYHYFATPDAAFAWLGAPKPIGGRYIVPAEWRVR